MSWFWIAVIVCIVCSVIASISQGEEDKQNAKATAQLPEKLTRLLAEEYPAHASAFTYSRCQAVVTWLGSKDANRLLSPYMDMFGNVKINPSADHAVARIYAQHLAPIFGDGVAAMAQSDPDGFLRTFRSCYTSASNLAAA